MRPLIKKALLVVLPNKNTHTNEYFCGRSHFLYANLRNFYFFNKSSIFIQSALYPKYMPNPAEKK